jgi:hypothetical protein
VITVSSAHSTWLLKATTPKFEYLKFGQNFRVSSTWYLMVESLAMLLLFTYCNYIFMLKLFHLVKYLKFFTQINRSGLTVMKRPQYLLWYTIVRNIILTLLKHYYFGSCFYIHYFGIELLKHSKKVKLISTKLSKNNQSKEWLFANHETSSQLVIKCPSVKSENWKL